MAGMSVSEWFSQVGFAEDPFAEEEASRDQRLPECFVEPAWFHVILGSASNPRTTIVFASRGAGKTAIRMMVHHWCVESIGVGGKVFSISYDRDCLQKVYTGHGLRVRPWHHVDAILRQGCLGMLHYLVRHPRQYTQAGYRLQKCIGSLLKGYLDDETMENVLERRGLLSEQVNPRNLRNALGDMKVRPTVYEALKPGDVPAVELIWSLLSASDEKTVVREGNYRRLLTDFFAFAREVGMDAVYILVDGIDEFPPLDEDFGAAGLFLRPVFKDLALMELPMVAFKFFLPLEMKREIIAKKYVRADRVQWREVTWTEERLLEMLRARLSVFSNGQVSTLAAITEEGFRSTVDEELVRCARLLPRNVIKLGAAFFEAHVEEATQDDPLLTRRAFELAIARFRELKEPPGWTKMFP